MLKIKRMRAENGTRIHLSGELRCAHLADLHSEIEQVVQPITLDLDEVEVVDIEGIRFLNECATQTIQIVNCSPYIREWMTQERSIRPDDK